jgi:hypothetical protein
MNTRITHHIFNPVNPLIGGIGVQTIFTAILAVAIAFTLNACSGGDDDSGGGGGGNNNGGGASCGKLMSTNLNVDVAGSVCYDNNPANCTKYGRLYDWATAMKLPAKCNTTLSTVDPDCAIQNKHQGICPSGQHIPSRDELTEYGNYGCLKNQPGGYGISIGGGGFTNVGGYGFWWSASGSSATASYRVMTYSTGYMFNNYGNKDTLYSVRCVQD